jgi:hypothetical protein
MSDKPQHLPDLDQLKALAARRRGLSDRKRVARALLGLIDAAHDFFRSDQHDAEILTEAGWTMATLGETMLEGELHPGTLVALVLRLYWPPGMARVDRNHLVNEMFEVAVLALRHARDEPFVRGFTQSEAEVRYDGSDPLVARVEIVGALRWLVDKELLPPVAAALVQGRDPVAPERAPPREEAAPPRPKRGRGKPEVDDGAELAAVQQLVDAGKSLDEAVGEVARDRFPDMVKERAPRRNLARRLRAKLRKPDGNSE